ncbi:MAG: glucose 1-dehydrogenase [Streptosporangiaceae bacterium]|jgi:7-alpha-hydroxysteroid dehydrogenase
MTQAVQSTPPGQGADEFRLDGYVALVTGAGRGIGAGIARAYARAGADVVLVARTATELEDVAAAVRAAGRLASVIPADLTDVSRAMQIVERAIAGHGRLDILVNNAGGAMPAAYLDTTPEALDAAFHFNVAAPFELAKRATPYLLDSGRGSVINITSRMDRLAARQMVTYGTVKAALAQLTRLLAVELAPGVRVNAIAPGVVETDGLLAVLNDELRRQIVSATPLHRLATVADVANTARWLASPAASYVTGKVIEIDGGAEAPTFPDDTPDLQPAKKQ